MKSNNFGLYIHIPFCIEKCNYCDFNSVALEDELATEFLSALYQEVKLVAAKYDHPQLRTIFIGGGTPTCLSGQVLADLIAEIKGEFKLDAPVEISSEANPGTLTEAKLKQLKQAGVNRLSLGVQSFDDQLLNFLGRIHSVAEVKNNYNLARQVGFTNLNLDLIFAIPNQNLTEWQDTLEEAVKLQPEHLSTYNLQIEPDTEFGTRLADGKLEPVAEELDLKMYQLAQDILAANNYQQYEISNFAQPGYRSLHNQIYWHNQPYLALGPGAHFYDGQLRGYNLERIPEYISTIEQGELPVAHTQQLSEEDKIVESMILGLRLLEGIKLADFKERFGRSVVDIYDQELEQLTKQGLIELDSDRIALTERGILLANDVLAEFIL
ncbi:MAG: radical SAM family heme chaperone HemW [Bacillota bacterium]